MVPAVEVVELSKRYPAQAGLKAGRKVEGEAVDALVSAHLRIEPGEIFALLGPNGAGKTTLIGCVAGLIRATSGTARVLGHDVEREAKITRRAVGLVPQEINFDPFFTVEESLRFQAGYFGVRLTDARLEEILGALGLSSKRYARTRALSGGMKRRLLIGKALVHDPKVLFLDEPTAGVDLELRRDLWAYVRSLRARGTTVVLTTHYLEEAEELADRIAFIDKGRILLTEAKEAVLARFGKVTLRLRLTARLAEVPEALRGREARLVEGGEVLELVQPRGEELGAALRDALAAGIQLRDLETRATGLEDVYVELLGRKNGRPA